MSAPLYNLDILRLAASSANLKRLPDASATCEKRSPLCGSRITIDIIVDKAKRIEAIGGEVRACALGQAATALVIDHAVGRSAGDVETARVALEQYLDGSRDDPGSWPGLALFADARPYAARHASIRLAFEALADATRIASQ